MIEFNLLPDVKLKYVKTRRIKRMVTLVAIFVMAVALAVFVFLIVFVDLLQKKNLKDINHDIQTNSSQLQSVSDLNKILTIQNQLQALPALHNAKPVASRLFAYLAALTPAQATIASVNTDFQKHTMVIQGNADNLTTVNQFVDTLKFTTYTTPAGKSTPSAFSNVVLTTFSSTDKGASYTITFAYDPIIFSEVNTVALTVPKITSTRSVTEQPTDLFKQSTPGTK